MVTESQRDSFQTLVSAVLTPTAAEQWLQEIKAEILSKSNVSSDSIQPVPEYFISVASENREDAFESIGDYLFKSQPSHVDGYPCENHVAYPQGGSASPDTFYIYMIAVVAMLAVLCAYMMQLPAEAKSYATLRGIGITKTQLACLMLTESALLCAPAVLLGIPLGISLTWLALRLLMYAGSVPIQVDVPYKTMALIMLLWLVMVLLSRLIVFFVTIRTPLVRHFQLQAAKARHAKRYRSALITLLVVAFSTVSVFTVLESLHPIYTRQWWKSCPAYVLWASQAGTDTEKSFPSAVNQENLDLIKKVPGVISVDGFAEAQAALSFDEDGAERPIWIYAVDDAEWDITFDFGNDTEAFRKGDICLLCLPDDGNDYLLPEKDVTIHVKDENGTVIACSPPTPVSVRRISNDGFNRMLANICKPYTVICSHSYMERLVSSMTPDTEWNVFFAGEEYGYDRVYVSVDMNAQDLSTDMVMAALCAKNHLVFSNRQQETTAYIQEFTQQLILLYTSSISVILVLLMILVSAVSLETEQEKRYYRTLRVLGMSKRQ